MSDLGWLSYWPTRWAIGTLDLLLPPVCASCGGLPESDGQQPALCDRCRDALLAERVENACTFCGVARSDRGDRRIRCADCRRRRYAFQQVVPLGAYRGALRRMVIRMKQFHEYPLTSAVGTLLADELAGRLQQYFPHVVVPIPRYWLKRWLQGSNSAEVLADVVGRTLKLPVDRTALRWRRTTQKQSLLPLGQRRRNLAGALGVSRRSKFQGAHVLVLDDIMTTGATAGEAARVLRRAGAQFVTVGIVGRALVTQARGTRAL